MANVVIAVVVVAVVLSSLVYLSVLPVWRCDFSRPLFGILPPIRLASFGLFCFRRVVFLPLSSPLDGESLLRNYQKAHDPSYQFALSFTMFKLFEIVVKS